MNDKFQIEKSSGDNPSARFGHTITLVSSNKAILFGGAVGDAGKFVITNQTYILDIPSNQWRKMECTGSIPSQRAAHDAAAIDNQNMVVFGGAASGGGGLCNDDLFVLNIVSEKWSILNVEGQTPGKRYGNTLVFNRPNIIVFGGNTGVNPVNDVWILNVEKQPFCWSKLQLSSGPDPRVYHTACICPSGSAAGMMIIFGGRGANQAANNETWGLRKHRDGRWDWIQAPYKKNSQPPLCRYQHSISFIGSMMVVVGGRTNKQDELDIPIEVYDTESSEWIRGINLNRYRFSSFINENKLMIHGGFEPITPNKPLESLISYDLFKINKIQEIMKPQKGILEQKNTNIEPVIPVVKKENFMDTFNKSSRKKSTTPLRVSYNKQAVKTIRMSNKAVVASSFDPDNDFTDRLVKVPLTNLQEEWKKVGMGFQDPNTVDHHESDQISDIFFQNLMRPKEWKNPMNDRFQHMLIIYQINKEKIIQLCDELIGILEQQPTLVKVRAPCKIFGSLYGRYGDLMRIFDQFGEPSEENGDLERFNYCFLGNYVDRGQNSLELICMLFALKLKHPDSVHLVRGKHDDMKVNKVFGFAEECSYRLQENIYDPSSVYQKINEVFEYLPLAALIENKVLCVSGGLGKNLNYISQIESIQRPINVFEDKNKMQPLVFDILWSQFSQNPQNEQDTKDIDIFQTNMVYKFGNNRVQNFLNENNLTMIIRSGNCTSEGFELNSTKNMINFTSCTDYAGIYNNSAAVIKIKKNFEISPLVIQSTNIQQQAPWINFQNPRTNLQFSEEELALRKRSATPLQNK